MVKKASHKFVPQVLHVERWIPPARGWIKPERAIHHHQILHVQGGQQMPGQPVNQVDT